MARRLTTRSHGLVVVALGIGGLIACSSAPEEGILRQYFQASRARDNVTLGNIATVSFSPNQEGIVESFKVVGTAPEETKQLRIKELAAALAEAQKVEEEFSKKKKDYQDANIEAIDRVIKVEAGGGKLAPKDAAIQTEWTRWRQEAADYARKVNDAKAALSAERTVAEVSTSRSNVNVGDYDATLRTRVVTVAARVKKGDAATQDRQLQVRLQKADLSGGPGGKTVEGRWIVTNISGAS